MKNRRKRIFLFIVVVCVCLVLGCCYLYKTYLQSAGNEQGQEQEQEQTQDDGTGSGSSVVYEPITFKINGYANEINVPAFDDEYYVTINNSIPFFDDITLSTTSFEQYAELDELNRCGQAIANIGKDIMPTEDRGDINSVTPTAWVQNKYDHISGKYLYNRCHIIGHQLAGENANPKNLITGTRAFNVDAMLLFENIVADYVKETDNHVLLRVTPIFLEKNLLASGVLMEAKSVEDNGEGVQFNAFCYNTQSGVCLDYKTGKNWKSGEEQDTNDTPVAPENEQEEVNRIDTNGNGIISIAEAEAAGYHMPICTDHWLYKYMQDPNGDGTIG